MITVRNYAPADSALWNDLVVSSRNGNFLHFRNYMDYHADRFTDRSLIVFRLDKPVGVFPASLHGTEIRSHGGLTYGGLIINDVLGASEVLDVFDAMRRHYVEAGIQSILYKPVPAIFHRYPCEEDLYALFRMGARLVRRDASSVIALGRDFRYTKGRKWSINKARKAKVTIRRSSEFNAFHALLSEVLRKFDTAPTHSLSELTLLAERFPDAIHCYEARLADELAAGAIIYDFGDTVHTQYLAASSPGRAIGALDYLIAHLIEEVYAERKYFSFGISTEQQGQYLNTGLVAQKEGFGARTIVHDFYEWIL